MSLTVPVFPGTDGMLVVSLSTFCERDNRAEIEKKIDEQFTKVSQKREAQSAAVPVKERKYKCRECGMQGNKTNAKQHHWCGLNLEQHLSEKHVIKQPSLEDLKQLALQYARRFVERKNGSITITLPPARRALLDSRAPTTAIN